MPTITKHNPGSFCWVELMTSDQSAAKNFYTKLFGWTYSDAPMGEAGVYTMLELNGKNVGALFQRGKQDERVPPHWNCYVAVDNVDASSSKAASLGATLMMPPFDVMDIGRMSVMQDPTGAVLSLWQGKKHTGAAVVAEPGAMCWHELGTGDDKSAGTFYTQLFGWGTKLIPGEMPYTVFSNAGQDIGGMYRLTEQMKGVPPHWLPYFQVTDCDASVQKAVSMGGTPVVPPTDIPGTGRFAYVQDPQGAIFAVIKLNPR